LLRGWLYFFTFRSPRIHRILKSFQIVSIIE